MGGGLDLARVSRPALLNVAASRGLTRFPALLKLLPCRIVREGLTRDAFDVKVDDFLILNEGYELTDGDIRDAALVRGLGPVGGKEEGEEMKRMRLGVMKHAGVGGKEVGFLGGGEGGLITAGLVARLGALLSEKKHRQY